jgi:hypothetical protein
MRALVLAIAVLVLAGDEDRPTLRDASDAEILATMGFRPRPPEPEEGPVEAANEPLWSSKPHEAALAFAERNRGDEHRKAWRLVLDEESPSAPPERCGIRITYESDRSYFAVDVHAFLRCDPRRSYLALAATRGAGIVFSHAVHDAQRYELELLPLSFEDARQAAGTLWWLRRLRTEPTGSRPGSNGYTTADGKGAFGLRVDGSDAGFSVVGRTWSGGPVERWREKADDEAFVNLSLMYLFEVLIPRIRPAEASEEAEEPVEIDDGGVGRAAARSNERRLEILALRSAELLERFTVEEVGLSCEIAEVVAWTAGDLGITSLREPLEKLDRQLARTDAGDVVRTPIRRRVRGTVGETLRKLDLLEDVEKLEAWAASGEEGCRWAARQLRRKAPDRYPGVLEAWIELAGGSAARHVFDELCEVAPERAAAIAVDLTPEPRRDLAVRAYSFLASRGEIPEKERRRKALVEIVLEPGSDWQERGDVLDALVPKDDPLRDPSKELDAVLLRLLDAELGDEICNFTGAEAARCLARRGRLEHFDRLITAFRDAQESDAKPFETTFDMDYTNGVLEALAELARRGEDSHRKRVAALLAPQLERTTIRPDFLLWAAWTADLRELAPRIEKLATAGPDEEDGELVSGGSPRVPPRLHLGRRILAIWREEDPLTRARLLVAFAVADGEGLLGTDERILQMLAEAVEPLTDEQRAVPLRILETWLAAWREGHPAGHEAEDPPIVAPLREVLKARD